MFKFFANILGYVLNFIYGFVGNYGIAIIIFTILVKGIMLPISIKQQKTMKKSAKIQEEAKKIQEKYSNDQVRQSQELMDLYKRENMSPFSGCLSSIVQIVLILAVFYLVSSPLTYMKKVDYKVIETYTAELKEERNVENINYPEIAIIKEKADEDETVNINMEFLGLDLSDVPTQDYTDWTVYIIPVLYVLTSLVSTKLTTAMNKPKEEKEVVKTTDKKEEDNSQEDMMEEMNKQMRFMMPIMTVSIALIAPLGLALYWLVSNILMIGERLVLDRFFKGEEE
ncbi:MAG: YidC/Oxa1 family membrane protein insertase [Clostridia bacterium]|nr:YidC/Oxa1 family membrane protein insertase [Clostridia bacterium]